MQRLAAAAGFAALLLGGLGIGFSLSPAAQSQVLTQCACDPAHPETLAARQCGLCREAEKQPPDVAIFFLKDINPTKPNRWLVLPRAHHHLLSEMTAGEREQLWAAAIAKGKELFGDGWGLALNGRKVVTQCHAHIHIGKLLPGIETDNFIVVDGPAGIPVPQNEGLWVHPDGAKLHVHRGEQITETVLLR